MEIIIREPRKFTGEEYLIKVKETEDEYWGCKYRILCLGSLDSIQRQKTSY